MGMQLKNDLRVSQPSLQCLTRLYDFDELNAVCYPHQNHQKGKRPTGKTFCEINFHEYQNCTLSKALTFIIFLEIMARILSMLRTCKLLRMTESKCFAFIKILVCAKYFV